jgi:hypothetical protein
MFVTNCKSELVLSAIEIMACHRIVARLFLFVNVEAEMDAHSYNTIMVTSSRSAVQAGAHQFTYFSFVHETHDSEQWRVFMLTTLLHSG